MKTGVLFYSMTGHSKKIALAISKALQVDVFNAIEKPTLNDFDLLFIVGGIYGGKSHDNLINFLKALNNKNVKKVVLITSSCGGKGTQNDVRSLLKANNIEVIEEEYVCLGSFLFFKMGHPNKQEIANAVEFARNINL